MKLIVQPTDPNYEIDKLLKYAHPHDAGADVFLQEDIVINPGKNVIPLGFKMILPPGVMALVFPRSSKMGSEVRYDLAPFDPGYSGVWNLVVNNTGDHHIMVDRGERICQIVLLPYIQGEFVKELTNLRGEGGLGSTGK